MQRGPEDREEVPSPLVEMARFSGHGLTMAMSTGLFLFLGWWLDGKVGTVPLFTILGAFLGAGAGFYYIIRHLVLLPREAAARRAREGLEKEDREKEDRGSGGGRD